MPTAPHFRTCNLCEAMCGIAIEVEDGRVSAIRGDADELRVDALTGTAAFSGVPVEVTSPP